MRIAQKIYNDFYRALNVDKIVIGRCLIKYPGKEHVSKKVLINENLGGFCFDNNFVKTRCYPRMLGGNKISFFIENQRCVFLTGSAIAGLHPNIDDSETYYFLTICYLVESSSATRIIENCPLNNIGSLNNINIHYSSLKIINKDERVIYDEFSIEIVLLKSELNKSGHRITDVLKDWNWLNYISKVFEGCVKRQLYRLA